MNTFLKIDIFLKMKTISKEIFNKKPELRDLPQGGYMAVLRSMELTESKAGNQMIKSVFVVTEGEFCGHTEYDYLTFTQTYLEGQIKVLLKRARILGIMDESSKLETIFEKLGTIKDVPVILTIELVTGRSGITRKRLTFATIESENANNIA